MNEQSAADPQGTNQGTQKAANQDMPPAGAYGNAQGLPEGAELTPEQMMQAASDRITALEAELAEMKERWMRAEAENANVRARGRKDADDARQYAVQKFATDIVETAENLRRGIGSLPQGDKPSAALPEIVIKVREGLEGVERSFLGTLERNGIKREDPVGQTFDPNLHQAMAEQESELHKPGTIMQAWSAAWTLNGRLLKPAMVVVAKAPTAELAASQQK
jgi:molecular chaperone GrpE